MQPIWWQVQKLKLKLLLQENKKSFIECAHQVLNHRPAAAVLLVFAHIVQFVLSLKVQGFVTNRQPHQLKEQIQALVGCGAINQRDIEVIVKVESLASQTFRNTAINESQVLQTISDVQQMIARVDDK